MCRLMIYVYERSPYSREELNLILQLLAEIMCAIKRSVAAHYNVHFDEQVLRDLAWFLQPMSAYGSRLKCD